MISLRQSIMWRVGIVQRWLHHFIHIGLNPLADLLPKNQITAVVVGRNDNYIHDFERRLTICLEWAFQHGLSEAIWVEWNPPPKNSFLAYSLTEKFPNLKAYIVPAKFHEAICENPAFKLMEYHAKNVGIRRASTPWICGTNADIIWGKDTFPWFSLLRKNTVYQAQRIDFDWKGEHISRMLLKDKSRYLNIYRTDYIPIEGPGDFTLAHRDLWFQATGYDESLRKQKRWCDDRGILQFVSLGAKLSRIGTQFHLDHESSSGNSPGARHGEMFNTAGGLPYKNDDGWGLGFAKEKRIADRIWLLE